MFILQKVSAREWVQRHTSSRKKCNSFSFETSSLHSEDNICVFKTWQKEICLFSVYFTQAMNLAGGQKLVTILFIFLAPLVLTHLPMSERCPAVFHKCTSLQVSQVHKWKCQNIRLMRAREVVNASQMQSIRRWIYFLAKGSFWPKTAKCRRELCTSNESSPLLYPWPTFKSWRTSNCHRHHHSSYLFSVSLSWSPTLSPLQISVWISPTSSASMSSILPFFSSMQSLNNNIMWLRTK